VVRRFLAICLFLAPVLANANSDCLSSWVGNFDFSAPVPVSSINPDVSILQSLKILQGINPSLKSDLDKLDRIIHKISSPQCGQILLDWSPVSLKVSSTGVTGVNFSMLCSDPAPRGQTCEIAPIANFGNVTAEPLN
jgi:hypothetical protein